MGDSDYLAAFHHLVMPIAAEFNPQLVLIRLTRILLYNLWEAVILIIIIIISCGFDAAIGDPEGEMRVFPAAFGHMTRHLSLLAGGRLVALLEGGYCYESIALDAAWTLKSLMADALPSISDSLCSSPHSSLVDILFTVANKYRHRFIVCKVILEILASIRRRKNLEAINISSLSL